jgi:tetratricopeptide (TPR) repeat protein
MEFPYDEITLDSRLKDLQVALLRSGGARRQALTREETGVREFGQAIFDALLSGDARSRYDVSSQDARRQGKGLRLKLRIRPPELARLPWEYLYDSRVGEYVCLSRDTPVVRFLETAQPVEPLIVTPPLRILAMVVSPRNLPELDTDREKQRVERALAPVQEAGLAELEWLHGETWRDLQRAMWGGPWHVFHFIGHGGFDTGAEEGVIGLADEQGNTQRLLATEVGRLLADHHSLRLVIINSCHGARASREDIFSSTAAVLVRRGIPAVLAMQDEITDRAAIEFARAFYESLGEGLPVDASVSEARKAVSLAVTNTMEWGTPVLYMRTRDGVIFDIPESGRRPVSAAPPPSGDDGVLEAAYTEALSAYWVGDWVTATNRLRSIVAENPEYADASSKLAEAEQRLAWESLYTQASVTEEGGDLEAAIGFLEKLVAEAPDYLDAEPRLVALRNRARLDELLVEAQRLSEAEQWRAVVGVFAEIRDLEPNYDDPQGLLSAAEKGAIELEQRERLEAHYALAVRQMDGGEWDAARKLFIEIRETDPDHREAVQLLARCEGELARIASAQRQAQQVSSLYEEAAALAQAEQWREAVSKLDQLAQIDANSPDPESIRERALATLDAEEAQAERQKDAAATYAEAVLALKSDHYQEALDKWNAVEELDPSFVDRRKVAASARQKLTGAQAPADRRAWWLRPSAVTVWVAGVLAVLVGGIVLVLDSGGVPEVFDDFDNASADAPYDGDLWTAYPANAEIGWAADALTIRESGADEQTGLTLTDYEFDPTQSMYLEARLRLNPNAAGGNVMFGLCCQPLDTNCGVAGDGPFCFFANHSREDEDLDVGLDLNPSNWHVLGIEFDADLLRFTYFINGEPVGSASPSAELLEETIFGLFLRVHNHEGPSTMGYVDYVEIGPLDG